MCSEHFTTKRKYYPISDNTSLVVVRSSPNVHVSEVPKQHYIPNVALHNPPYASDFYGLVRLNQAWSTGSWLTPALARLVTSRTFVPFLFTIAMVRGLRAVMPM